MVFRYCFPPSHRLSEKESRTLTFPALQQIVGLLNVNYRPLDADVLVDGKRVGILYLLLFVTQFLKLDFR